MRIRIRHETTYRYAEPPRTAVQHLRLTPRSHDGQHVVDWRIDVDRDCRLVQSEDAFGNTLHRFSVDGPLESISTVVEGEVTTFDIAGVVSGAVERFPPVLFMRDTPLTTPNVAICDFARETTSKESGTLSKLHALLGAIHESLTFDAAATHSGTTAAECFEHRKGVCQDYSHLFIACARGIGAPARYVSGYFLGSDGEDQVAGHAWAEAYVEDLGWVAFDPTHGVSPQENHVRVAIALDYLGAAPIRGSHSGGGGETLDVKVRVARAASFSQSQSQ